MWSYRHPLRSDELMHSGRPGTHWYQHKFGDWDDRAKYAVGQQKEIGEEIKRVKTEKKQNRWDRGSARYRIGRSELSKEDRKELKTRQKAYNKSSRKYRRDLTRLQTTLGLRGGAAADERDIYYSKQSQVARFAGYVLSPTFLPGTMSAINVGGAVVANIASRLGGLTVGQLVGGALTPKDEPTPREKAIASRTIYNHSKTKLSEFEKQHGLR